MKKKQTYIIGEEHTPNKKVNKPKQKKKPAKNNQSKPFKTKEPKMINTAFADAFAKAGLTADTFKKKS
tara:strand:- start:235 stop:438 length:204 start_codon:yes stop_codon:yes gene_type:complete